MVRHTPSVADYRATSPDNGRGVPLIGGRAVALSGAVIGLGLLGDTLIYAVLPLYHVELGMSLAMVGVLLSLNRWTRLLANSLVAGIGEHVGARRMMVLAALGSVISTTCYGLDGGEALQIAARILWGISFAALNLGSLAYAVADRANAGKRVGASRGLIGVIQASCFIGGGLLVLQIGPRHVFLVLGALTLLAVIAALRLPPLHSEPSDRRGFRLPMPHRLEIWGFLLGFSGDGVFLLTLAFLLKDSVTSVAPIMATALVLSLRCVMEASGGPVGGWMGDRFGARLVATVTGTVLVAGYLLIACHIDVVGSIVIVLSRGLFNTLIPVMVMQRVTGGYLSSQASYSTWRDFGAAVGPLTAPWLFLNIPQSWLFAALGVMMAAGVTFCLARK
ncbi:MFS transporter [Reyranella sp.]|uniref:MFS transporter n=1 Tax=Reyranella sp. TaxID=1929291 RepID=UPI003D14F951